MTRYDMQPDYDYKPNIIGPDKSFVGNSAMQIKRVECVRNLYRSSRPGFPAMLVARSIMENAAQALAKNRIEVIVDLLTDGESYKYYGMDLVWFYRNKLKLKVCRFPIPDFSTPRPTFMLAMCKQIALHLLEKRRVLVHCSAGMGRTGLALNCFAQYRARVLNVPIVNVGTVENQQQDNYLKIFGATMPKDLQLPRRKS